MWAKSCTVLSKVTCAIAKTLLFHHVHRYGLIQSTMNHYMIPTKLVIGLVRLESCRPGFVDSRFESLIPGFENHRSQPSARYSSRLSHSLHKKRPKLRLWSPIPNSIHSYFKVSKIPIRVLNSKKWTSLKGLLKVCLIVSIEGLLERIRTRIRTRILGHVWIRDSNP